MAEKYEAYFYVRRRKSTYTSNVESVDEINWYRARSLHKHLYKHLWATCCNTLFRVFGIKRSGPFALRRVSGAMWQYSKTRKVKVTLEFLDDEIMEL